MPGKFICSLLIALCITQVVYGQFEKLQNYNVKDGLPSSEVYGVIQDSKGYIWLNSDIGVSRFNGYEFKNYSIENGLPDNTVFGIYEDGKNRIWFRSMSGKLAYLQNENIFVLPCNKSIEKLIGNNFINSIYVDKGDTIWLGTTADFCIKIIPGWKITDVQRIDFEAGKYILQIDETGFVFGGTGNEYNIITVYNKKKVKLFRVNSENFSKKEVKERFYLIQLKNGSYLASIGNKLINFKNATILSQKEESSAIINMIQDTHGALVVGNYTGISIYANANFKDPKIIQQLKNKVITGLCQDKEEGFWITTEGHGVYYMPHPNVFYFTIENGISESKISCMGQHDSAVVIGHIDGSLNILKENSVSTVPQNGSIKNSVVALRNTSISNYGNTTIVTSQNNITYLKKTGLSLVSNKINGGGRKFIRSNDGNAIGLHFNYIIKYDLKDQFKKIYSIDTKIRTDNIYEDKDTTLWICTINGIYTYRNKKLIYKGNENKLFKYRTSSISQKNDGSLWFATLGGGVIVKSGDKLIQITDNEGLVGNICKSIFIDSNIVWVGTNKGLSRITTLQNEIYKIDNFYAKNGLLTNEVNAILMRNKKLWLAHNNGISIFDVENIKPNKRPPPVYIEQVFVNDSLFAKEKLMNLNYDQNYLTINYIGLSYKDAGNVEYRYKVIGIDSNWITTHYTKVSYRTIPPGSYSFLVSAKNNDGYWSSRAAIITFKILPPWWKTLVFIGFVIIMGVLLIFFLLKYWLKIIKKRERLKAIQQSKLANAELKALRSQMNPHFVFNAINSVQYFITNNDPISSQKYLSKFAKLIRYVVDNSKPSAIPLGKELEALNLYLDLESLRFENKFEYSIEVNNNVDVENVKIPSMLMQPYIENAIWHGLMHKTTAGKIKIEINLNKNVLICIIEDNGIGREKAQKILKEKRNEFHQSVGMSITQERLDVINQQNKSNLTVKIIDLKDDVGNATGTRVELNLPFY